MKLIKYKTLMKWNSFKESRQLDQSEYIDWDPNSDKDIPNDIIYVSHRWISKNHPDPHDIQLKELKKRLLNLLDSCQNKDNVFIFYDYSSILQKPRTKEEDKVFLRDLQTLRQMLTITPKVIILSEGYEDFKNRMWCFFELLVADRNIYLFEDQKNIDEDLKFRNNFLARPEDLGITSAWIANDSFNYNVYHLEMEAIVASFQHLDSCRATNKDDIPLIKEEVVRYYNLRHLTPFGRFLIGLAKYFKMELIYVSSDAKINEFVVCKPYFEEPNWIRLPMNDRNSFSILAVEESKYYVIKSGVIPFLRLTKEGLTDSVSFIDKYRNAPDWKDYLVPPAATTRWCKVAESRAFPTIDHVMHTALEFMGGLGAGPNCLYLSLLDKNC